jgi:predicted nucleic acid-binding protein
VEVTVLVDTGPIVSLADRNDSRHRDVKRAWRATRGPFVTSIAVVPEVSYLLLKYLGPPAELSFLESWQSGEIRVEPVRDGDLSRILEILRTYEDQRFGFADSSLFALAERLKIRQVLTFDRRHFDSYRPAHCSAWEHLLNS